MSQQTISDVRHNIDYLVRSQRANGSFDIVCNHPDHSVATPIAVDLGVHALMLDILLAVDNPELETVVDGIATYLNHRIGPLLDSAPKDLDTYSLFYGLSVLHEYSSQILSPQIIAVAVRLLVDHEQAPGGPYYNALDDHTGTPDWLTNTSISRFIHHVGGPFPKLTAYIAEGSVDFSRYYTAAWPLQFLCASAEHSQLHPSPPQVGSNPDPIEYIHKDPSGKSDLLYGATSLTIATSLATSLAAPRQAKNSLDYYVRLAELAQADTLAFDPLVGDMLQARLTKLIAADTSYEIGPLAERFAQHLKVSNTPDTKTLQTLGLANLYNWVAYTIYDDFLDDEGNPHLLSTANIALRRAANLFCGAIPHAAFTTLVWQTFDTIDTANTWEIENCRFTIAEDTIHIALLPDYADLHCLHDRSLSHGLPIIGVLCGAGIPIDDPVTLTLAECVKQYLIIRQLNDDLCDWKDDLYSGHISYVVARVLQDAAVQPGPQSLTALLPKLEQVFWKDSLRHIETVLQQRANKAHELLTGCTVLAQDNLLTELIDNLANAATHMRTAQQQTNDFLQAFQSETP